MFVFKVGWEKLIRDYKNSLLKTPSYDIRLNDRYQYDLVYIMDVIIKIKQKKRQMIKSIV